MSDLQSIFTSPEFYPLRIDFKRRVVIFLRMSRDSYRDSIFLDVRTQPVEKRVYQIRLDDLLFVSDNLPPPSATRVHYILHTTFCCSTLLARYFELIPLCFVLKEPLLLTQLALEGPKSVRGWSKVFDVGIRLLTRTYTPGGFVVIKPHEPSNVLGRMLLERNQHATVTFVITPLRHFLLSVLKSEERRRWVRTRIPHAGNAARCPDLLDIKAADLSDAAAAAYLWLVSRFLCDQLSAFGPRVLVLNGERLVDFPVESLAAVMNTCGIPLSDEQLKVITGHPSVHMYSKDLSRPYDASSRHREIRMLEDRWGKEADGGVAWALSRRPDIDIAG